MKIPFLLCYATIALFVACSTSNIVSDKTDTLTDLNYRIIPQEEALAKLNAFLDDVESDTKGTGERKIQSVDVFPPQTKSCSEVEAYVVNYENNGGYAVLGARTDMVNIIAVTDKGNIDPSTLSIIDPPAHGDDSLGLTPLPGGSAVIIGNGTETVVDNISYENLYSLTDDDYYIGGDISDFISSSISIGIRYREDASRPVVDYDDVLGDEATNPSGTSPLRLNLLTTWDQDSPYNGKCKLLNNGTRRLAGCSSTAAGMIVAYNKYPSNLYIDETKINWENVRSTEMLYSSTSEPTKSHVQLLLGYFFWKSSRLAGNGYTLITPTQIKKRFQDLGYENVTLYKDSDFTDEMMSITTQMIRNNKPLFVSAMRYSDEFPFLSGHSWVIEGVDTYNKMVYCNWGWDGSSNGYFSTDCFVVGENDYNFHFRLISYDKPSRTVTKNFDL